MHRSFIFQTCGLATLLFAVGGTFAPLWAETWTERKLPPQAEVLEGVIVPVPGEVFKSLDAFPEPNWQRVLRPHLAQWKPAGSQVKIALRLGMVIAEGFIAIAAEDPEEVREVGRTALTLARALGIERSILRRSKSMLDHADNGNWKAVRAEWSNIGTDVRAAMLEIDSKPLSQLVSAGGWLRGMEALAALAIQGYSPEKAAILDQPVLLEDFQRTLASLKSPIQEDPLIAQLQEGLAKLRPLLRNTGEQSVSEKSVREISAVTRKLSDAIAANR